MIFFMDIYDIHFKPIYCDFIFRLFY